MLVPMIPPKKSPPASPSHASPAGNADDPWNKYEPTAARKHGKPGREARPKSITIDIHSHVAVPAAAEFVKPHFDPMKNAMVLHATPETRALNQKQEADIRPRITGYDLRLKDLDAMGIDFQLVMPPPPQCYYTVPPDIAVQAAQIVNDGIAEYVAGKPDRFAGLGSAPMPAGEEAAKELERCVKTLGLKGVQILTNVNGQELSDPAFAPFWKKAEELQALVVLHPLGFSEAKRLSRFSFNNTIGNPLDTTIALHYLIFDGVLERHPNLKILAVHGGGYLAAYSGRIDHAWGARSDAHGDLPHPPTSYLKKIYFDSVVFTPYQLAELVRLYGADHIIMGTDYPFDMADYDPIGHVADVDGLRCLDDRRDRGRQCEAAAGAVACERQRALLRPRPACGRGRGLQASGRCAEARAHSAERLRRIELHAPCPLPASGTRAQRRRPHSRHRSCATRSLLRLHAGLGRDLAPAREVVADEVAHPLRAESDRAASPAGRSPSSPTGSVMMALTSLLSRAVIAGGRFGGADQREPERRLEARHAGLDHRRNLRAPGWRAGWCSPPGS